MPLVQERHEYGVIRDWLQGRKPSAAGRIWRRTVSTTAPRMAVGTGGIEEWRVIAVVGTIFVILGCGLLVLLARLGLLLFSHITG
jgi:hypothetical protein